jgi:hypothetical protein
VAPEDRLEQETAWEINCTGPNHRRLLNTVSSLVFAQCKETARTLAEEFYLLANIDRLVEGHCKALANAALAKVRQQDEENTAQARARDQLTWDDLILPEELKDDLRAYCEILRRHEHYAQQGSGKATPSTKLPPGLQSQRTDAAISSGWPNRAIG